MNSMHIKMSIQEKKNAKKKNNFHVWLNKTQST